MSECRGIIVRASVSRYFAVKRGTFVEEKSIRILKRESCDGSCTDDTSDKICAVEHFKYDVDMAGADELNLCFDDIEDGEKYHLFYVPDPPDFETGISDDGYWDLKEVVE